MPEDVNVSSQADPAWLAIDPNFAPLKGHLFSSPNLNLDSCSTVIYASRSF